MSKKVETKSTSSSKAPSSTIPKDITNVDNYTNSPSYAPDLENQLKNYILKDVFPPSNVDEEKPETETNNKFGGEMTGTKLVGQRVQVYGTEGDDLQGKWWNATIVAFNEENGTHQLQYDWGGTEWNSLTEIEYRVMPRLLINDVYKKYTPVIKKNLKDIKTLEKSVNNFTDSYAKFQQYSLMLKHSPSYVIPYKGFGNEIINQTDFEKYEDVGEINDRLLTIDTLWEKEARDYETALEKRKREMVAKEWDMTSEELEKKDKILEEIKKEEALIIETKKKLFAVQLAKRQIRINILKEGNPLTKVNEKNRLLADRITEIMNSCSVAQTINANIYKGVDVLTTNMEMELWRLSKTRNDTKYKTGNLKFEEQVDKVMEGIKNDNYWDLMNDIKRYEDALETVNKKDKNVIIDANNARVHMDNSFKLSSTATAISQGAEDAATANTIIKASTKEMKDKIEYLKGELGKVLAKKL